MVLIYKIKSCKCAEQKLPHQTNTNRKITKEIKIEKQELTLNYKKEDQENDEWKSRIESPESHKS